MVTVKDFIERNKESGADIYIYLEREKENEFDPLSETEWEGALCNIPEEYWNNEVVEKARSLKQLEKGIDAFYLTMKADERSSIIGKLQDYKKISSEASQNHPVQEKENREAVER